MAMTGKELTELRELFRKSDPGYWRADEYGNIERQSGLSGDWHTTATFENVDTAKFVVTMWRAFSAMLTEIERSRQVNMLFHDFLALRDNILMDNY